jgi:predicted DCC family thiol-disulfide oxidoreductase YuxK
MINVSASNKNTMQELNCTVYFDGACPVCSKEIATYQKWVGADRIQWVDASACNEQDLGAALSRDAALARLHLRDADGKLLQGAAAFVELWKHLPAMAWITPFLSHSLAIKFLDVLYRIFLSIRPLWRKPLS